MAFIERVFNSVGACVFISLVICIASFAAIIASAFLKRSLARYVQNAIIVSLFLTLLGLFFQLREFSQFVHGVMQGEPNLINVNAAIYILSQNVAIGGGACLVVQISLVAVSIFESRRKRTRQR